ncbi:hypothetical protein D9756_008908 [Leucocoprinus leucothites]|uniref:Uncharacterized protein n=1 Tax=Leucocoprinus leucothites TaxID=201217 RepID=A0A8H5FTX0_9AGAR|nr:hypothetical protein D9756_008908 [Leucoagaricus leucothites]
MSCSFTVKKRLARVMIFDAVAAALHICLWLVVEVMGSSIDVEDIGVMIILSLPLLSVFVHNILRLKLRSWKYCWRIFELVYSLLELIAVGFQTLIAVYASVESDNSSKYLAYIVAGFLFILTYGVWEQGAFSILTACRGCRTVVKINRGKFLALSPESRLSVWARSCFAILCAALIAVIALYQFVLKPVGISGGNRVYVKAYRGTNPDSYIKYFLVGGLVVFPPSYNITGPLNDTITFGIIGQSGLVTPTPDGCRENVDIGTERTTVLCEWNSTETALAPQIAPATEIMFTVDFSKVAPHLPPHASFYIYNGGLSVAEEIVETMQPTIVRPGIHVSGVVTPLFRKPFNTRSIRSAVFGIPGSKGEPMYTLYKINELLPNPSPPDVNISRTASLRLVLHRPTSTLTEVDAREDTVFSGLGFIGGIWTAVNGIYAAIFGSTLLLVLFGTKPLSVYGLVHLFNKKLPNLYTDKSLEITQADRDDVHRIIRQHLLDVDNDEASSQHSEKDTESDKQGYEPEYEPLDLEGRN